MKISHVDIDCRDSDTWDQKTASFIRRVERILVDTNGKCRAFTDRCISSARFAVTFDHYQPDLMLDLFTVRQDGGDLAVLSSHVMVAKLVQLQVRKARTKHQFISDVLYGLIQKDVSMRSAGKFSAY